VSVVPGAPASVTAETVKTAFNVTDADAERYLQLAVTTLNRELAGAFRDVPQDVYDDCVQRIVGAIVGNRRRPTAGAGGQLTRTDQPGQQPAAVPPRDYVTPIRPTLALYVAPL
jgi:hypothetical protein